MISSNCATTSQLGIEQYFIQIYNFVYRIFSAWIKIAHVATSVAQQFNNWCNNLPYPHFENCIAYATHNDLLLILVFAVYNYILYICSIAINSSVCKIRRFAIAKSN